MQWNFVKCKSTKGSRGCNGMGWGGSGPSSLAEAGKFRFHRLFLFKHFQSFLKATYFKNELKLFWVPILKFKLFNVYGVTNQFKGVWSDQYGYIWGAPLHCDMRPTAGFQNWKKHKDQTDLKVKIRQKKKSVFLLRWNNCRCQALRTKFIILLNHMWVLF